MRSFACTLAFGGMIALSAAPALAEFQEYPIGDPVEVNHMQIAAVYLRPVTMEPHGLAMPASQASIHLEADIHATEGNPNGFGAGEWIPYLTVRYTLTNTDTGATQNGTFMSMVAVDGPHYGNNIQMPGPGNYHLVFQISDPSTNGMARHTDEDTGVGRWPEPFSVEYNFRYVPLN